jgi:ubiquinol-cytochrome c reductase core subunit 2
LGDVVSNQKFQDHEFVDVSKHTALESAYAYGTPAIAALEAAHNAAFRNGLGNSLYASRTSRVTNAAVKEYAQKLFTSGNVALVGTNVDHEELKSYADSFFNLGSGNASFPASKYYGGELRISDVTPNSNYVLAFQGAAAGTKEYAAAQVLRHVLGGEQLVKFTEGASLLSQAAAKLSGDVQINAFNFGYSDAGLFGVQVSAPSGEISSALSAVAEQLKAVQKGVSDEDLKRGIAQAKFAAAATFDSRLDRLDVLGRQVCFT